MAFKFSSDSIAFDINDSTVSNGFESFKDKDFNDLKKYFFTVMMHGQYDKVYMSRDLLLDAYEFAPILKKWHQKCGRGRAILLISCWAGWAFARPIARASQLPIAAGLSQVAFETIYAGHKVTSNIFVSPNAGGHSRAEWMFCHPTGQIETIAGGNHLDHTEAIKLAKKYVKA